MFDSFYLLNYKHVKGKKHLGMFSNLLYLPQYPQFLLSQRDLVSIVHIWLMDSSLRIIS